jgi:hypothetical protein
MHYPLPGHAQFPLEKLHPHPRDNCIIFWEEEHIYWLWNPETLTWEQSQGSISSLAAPHFEEFDQEAAVDKMMRSPGFPFKRERHAKYRVGSDKSMTREQILASWARNGTIQSNKGTKMHFDAECALNGIVYDFASPEMDLFRRWYAEWFRPRGLVPLRTEWEIFHRRLGLAGTIDFVGYYLNEEGERHVREQVRAAGVKGVSKTRKDGKLSIVASKRGDVCRALQRVLPGLDVSRFGCVVIIDWKRSKHVYEEYAELEEEEALKRAGKQVPPKPKWKMRRGVGPCSDMLDTHLNKYAIQVNSYAWVLAKAYGYDVKELYLVSFHSDWEHYVVHQCPWMQERVEELLEPRMRAAGVSKDDLGDPIGSKPPLPGSEPKRDCASPPSSASEASVEPDAVRQAGASACASVVSRAGV